MNDETSMNCATFIGQLDALLAARLDTAQAHLAAAHLEHCTICLAQWTEALAAHREPHASQRFASATLAALQLDPCAYVEEQAAAFLTNAMPEDARLLLTAHLATCPSCAELLSVMAELQQQLPALAHRPAPAGFTRRVLAATSDRVPAAGTRGFLQMLLQRPRFAAEAAYCCALAWSLVLGLPTLNIDSFLSSGQLFRNLEAQGLATNTGQLLAQGSNLGKERLQSAQAQLQTLYEQGKDRLEEVIDSIQPAAAELSR